MGVKTKKEGGVYLRNKQNTCKNEWWWFDSIWII